MKRTFLADCISFFFVLLFLYTGVAKLMEVNTFKEQLSSSPLLASLAGIITWVLPIGEILLAIALVIPVTKLKALYATLALMSLFTIYVIVILFMDNQLSCSCGGIIEELSPKQHVLFNGSCVVLVILAIVLTRKHQYDRRFTWMTGTSTIALFVLVGWILFTAFSAPPTTKTGLEGRLLPSFTLQLVDSTTHLNTADIPSGQPFIVIGFSPWCTHCQAETRDILQHIEQLKNVHIYYVTPYPFDQMKIFYRYFKLQQYPNITMGRDTGNAFLKFFHTSGVPYTTVFDAKKRLKKVFPQQAHSTELIQAAIME